MFQIKWFVFVAFICIVPGIGVAQQAGLPVPANQNNMRFAPEGTIAPLPPIGQAEQVPQPLEEPSQRPGMTLAELEDMATRCNPTLVQASARVQAARGQAVQVGLYPNPVAGYLGSEIGNEKRAGQQGGFVSQEVVTAGKLQLNRDVASQEIRQAEFVWGAQRFRVLTDVRRGFYEVLVAQRSMELSEQLVRLGGKELKLPRN